ncbi:DNA glycosylase [Scleroderma yunnanense]
MTPTLKRRRTRSTSSPPNENASRATSGTQGNAHATKKLKLLENHTTLSPYPSFTRPTVDETYAVYALLAAHTPGGAPVHVKPDSGSRTSTTSATCTSDNVLDALIYTILSQNTTAPNSARAKHSLDATFGTGEQAFERMVSADAKEIAHAIACGGLANRKAGTIQGLLRSVRERHGKYDLQHLHQCDVTDAEAMRELVSYNGVGPKTAACVLSFCLGRQAFAVDTHVFRLVKMLGWVPDRADRVGAQAHLELKVPPEIKYGLHLMMVKHGRVCAGCKNAGKGSCPLKAWLKERKS